MRNACRSARFCTPSPASPRDHCSNGIDAEEEEEDDGAKVEDSVAAEDVILQDTVADQEQDAEGTSEFVGSDVVRNCHVVCPLIFAFGRAASR